MVTWFAGLFYLPRLFIYHVQAVDKVSLTRFRIMEKRLFGIMTVGAALAAVFGLLLLMLNPALLGATWFQLKLLLLIGLVAYHYRCYRWMAHLGTAATAPSTTWLRWFNEIPAFFLLVIVLLAVTKPF
jgi:putative membrane protein